MTRLSSRFAVMFTAFALSAVLVLGVLAAVLVGGAPEASAGSVCGVETDCDEDATGTAVMTVRHEFLSHDGGDYVQVDPAAEDWTITAYWLTPDDDPYCSCEELTDSVTANVTWNAATGLWGVTCTGCNLSDPIRNVTICQGSTCGGGLNPTYAHSYKLIVDAVLDRTQTCPPGGTRTLHLDRVLFQTTDVSDGDILDWGDCSLGSAATTIYQSYHNNDGGAFDCGYDCDATGPEILISYE